mmetsp:Transcript_21855/g.63920  ORF Transcript_21855/g.63920 Transcript_21855/m.63920 type:complete len:167 (+) Transcript_21855:13-513(+)
MRGRTHEAAFVIVDEAQNASLQQLRRLSDRLGNGSTLCILGDGSQPDRRVGGNWSAGADGVSSSIEAYAKDLDKARETGMQTRIEVARLTNADICRSTPAREMRGFFSQIDSEEPAPRRQRLGGGAGELLRQAVAPSSARDATRQRGNEGAIYENRDADGRRCRWP